VTVNRNTLDWSISGREALYTGGLPETNTFSALKPVLRGRFGWPFRQQSTFHLKGPDGSSA